ncbi:MAG TPA: RidA family protein [Longimicrobiales bacterium]|nr:RidA family protein [Longimicrobiales bacterium]
MTRLAPVSSPRAPAAIGPYAQAVAAGDWIWCSGQIPVIPQTGELAGPGAAEQTEQVLANLAEVLRAAGSSLAEVVKTTVYLVDLADFEAMNGVYARRFGDHRPARATLQVAALPRGARVEIDCVALRRAGAPAG